MVDCLINRKSDRLLQEQFYKPFAFSLSLFAVVKGKKPHFLGSLLILYGYDAIQLQILLFFSYIYSTYSCLLFKKQNDNLIIFCTLDVKSYLNNFKLSMDMYRLFISHSWTYSDAYDCLIKLLEGQNFRFYDHSVPKNDPIHTKGSEKELRAAIDAQIKGTSCVLILAGVYATYSKWINIEIDIAKKYNKPIIAIEPWGAERTSAIVKNNAIKIVKWQGKSIVNAIIDVVE